VLNFRNPVTDTLRAVEKTGEEIADRVAETADLAAIAFLAITAVSLLALIVAMAALKEAHSGTVR
jgi:hypothetical protein